MKKRLAFILIITILINTVIPNFIYADQTTDVAGDTKFEDVQKHQNEKGESTSDEVFHEGTATVTPSDGSSRTESLGETATSSNTTASILASIIIGLPWLVNNVLTMIVNTVQTKQINGNFTIENLVFNEYDLFNINFVEYDENSTNTMDVLKKNVSTWYFALRNLAIVANAFILIYIGIRMAISTVAEEQAKYKKMFINWIVSLVLVFTMHYILIILLELQEKVIELIGSINVVSTQGFEESIINDTWNSFQSAKGWGAMQYAMVYFVFVYYQLKFFMAYFKRFLTVGFLFVISPLVTVTYSIDAAGDGKGQAFQAWLTNLIYYVFIQAIHVVVYAIYIISADEIAKAVPLFGAILIMTLSRAEKIVKTTFKLSGMGIADEKLLDKIKRGPRILR